MSLSRRSFIATSLSAAALAIGPELGFASSSTKSSRKKGIGGVAPENSGLVTSWYYNWGLSPASKGMPVVDSSIQFHPMCWGWKQATAPSAAGSTTNTTTSPENRYMLGLDKLRGQNVEVLFGFNEPDQHDQSNLAVDAAIEAWPSLQGIARELVGPSCAHPAGAWMEQFLSQLEKGHLRVDSLGYHSYGSDSVDSFVSQLTAFHQKYGRPVWVTEFAVADWAARDGRTVNRYSVERVAEFMRGACRFLEETPWIRGYAWFPRGGKFPIAGMRGPLASSVLFNEDGTLNDLGKLYASI